VRLDFQGKTALVTGASAGLGREMARILARDVGTLVLTARRQDRLDELSAELRQIRPDLRVHIHAFDLNHRATVGVMLDALEHDGVRIDILINNAGYGDYGLFEKSDWPKIEGMLELNMLSATFLLHRLIPGMVKRGFGAILNVGSTAGMVEMPGSAVYGATKAYLNHLSEALRGELTGTGVVMTALCPGPVETEFQGVAGTSKRGKLPEIIHVDVVDCAEQAIEALKRGRARVVPGLLGVVPLEGLPHLLTRPLFARIGKKLRHES
jgi:short-subunit dehydrogenase